MQAKACSTLLFLLLAGCRSVSTPPAQPAVGVAYAGPATLNLRKDLGTRAAPAGSVKHGERLDVLETRRRFVRVRTSSGLEGWTDANLLLSERQMDDLRKLASSASKLPSQGSATVYEALNVHAEPYRQSPSFFQIPEGGKVDVIGHRVSVHAPPPPPKPAVHRASATKKSKQKKTAGPLPPMPAPPGPPADWRELSRPRADDLPGYERREPPPGPPPEDWNLVRTSNGEVGWALARMLVMAIPDEVAQYAEGHRITAYLPLGEVQDKEKNETKQNWLWTTASAGQRDYEFDSFRVFVWSGKRHRYETAYIERNVKGYYPVETQPLPGQDEKGFSVVIEDKDGQRYKRIYGFTGYRVRMISRTLYQPPPPLPEVGASGEFEPAAEPAAPALSWPERLREWKRRWSGK